ncbi:hypothetical protein ANN_13629 [Periplaneta americana]|uniref:Histone-lysine N-methyltransferase SETMAR n=1 Tax=Periplaneta americana TaxID=6978 RepID=A0ABQ8TM50_PERAM|nr:hypothetical protein ANN_13629 [Periplaneta americana]
MVIGRKIRKINLRVLNEAVEQVDSFKYLGCTISCNMSCSQEVKRRIAMVKEAFNRKRSIFCGPLEKETSEVFCMNCGILFNDTVSTTRLFSVDGISDSEMVFSEMRPRIRHRLPDIRLRAGKNLGKNPTRHVLRLVTLEADFVVHGSSGTASLLRHHSVSADVKLLAVVRVGEQDLKTEVNDRILQDRRTSLDELHIAFPDISRSLLGEIVSQHLGYHKICARPHTAASTRELLDQFGWEIFDHPPYSPDLAPSDFQLFTKLKDFLGGTRFGSDEELKKTVNTWLNELAAEEYNTGILKLVNRYDKCLNVGGDYVEK